MCSNEEAAATDPREAPEGFVDRGGAVEMFREACQVMDTSNNEIDDLPDHSAGRAPLSLGVVGAGEPGYLGGPDSPNGGAPSAELGNGFAAGDGNAEGLDDQCGDSDWDPENLCAGWTFVGPRRRKRNHADTGASSQQGGPTAGKPNSTLAKNAQRAEEKRRELKAQHVARVNSKMSREARMPLFGGKDDHRVVIRPRGGLVVNDVNPSLLRRAIIAAARVNAEESISDKIATNAAQNIIVLSTPSEARSFRYGAIRHIMLGDSTYEAYAYKSAPSDTSRGVIKGVGPEDSDEDITRFLVNDHNPTILAAHRLGRTGSVVILFDGDRVPFHVFYDGVVMKCTLYRQHREVCGTCGQVGHRKDVCPTPFAKVCFACGRKNPDEEHKNFCKPRCRLCGGGHVTGAGSCKNKFKTPLPIRLRQAAKIGDARAAGGGRQPGAAAAQVARPPGTENSRLSRRDGSSSGSGSGLVTSRKAARSKSGGRNNGLTWADVASDEERRRKRSKSRGRSKSRERSKSRIRSPSREKREKSGREPNTARAKESAASQAMKPGLPQRIKEKKENEEPKEHLSAKARELKDLKMRLQKAESENQKLMAAVESLQRTVKQLRQEQLGSAGSFGGIINPSPGERTEEQTEAMTTDEPDPSDLRAKRRRESGEVNENTPPAKGSVSNSRKAKVAAARGLEHQVSIEEETAEESEDDERSTATGGDRPPRTPGYAGLHARLTRLENVYKKWDKNLEEMERRIVNKCMHSIQQMLHQALEQHTEKILQRVDTMLQERLAACWNETQNGRQQDS